mgnify:CR=1 FL=1
MFKNFSNKNVEKILKKNVKKNVQEILIKKCSRTFQIKFFLVYVNKIVRMSDRYIYWFFIISGSPWEGNLGDVTFLQYLN